MSNHNDAVQLELLQLEIDGRPFERRVRLEPGEARRISLQFLFPEDPGYHSDEPRAVEWRVTGALGIEWSQAQP